MHNVLWFSKEIKTLPCKSTPSSTSLSALLPSPSVRLPSSLFSLLGSSLPPDDPVSSGLDVVEAVDTPDSLSGGDADCSSVVSDGVGVEVVCKLSGSG